MSILERAFWTSFVFVLLQLDSSCARADTKAQNNSAELINCAKYRAKKDRIPVYAKAETTSKVVHHMARGEFVCHIGEQGAFAIIDWRKHGLINQQGKGTGQKKGVAKSPDIEITYVRLVDLWEPRDGQTKGQSMGLFDRIREHIRFLRYGGVPDDARGPFRPYMDSVVDPIECEAGKICEKVKEKMKQK